MRNHILAIFALVLAAAIFFGYVEPTWGGSIAKTQASITADNQALNSAQQYATQKNQLASARNAINPADLTAIKEFLPDSVDNVGLILDLNALAARSGLSVSNIDVAASGSSSNGSNGSNNASPAVGALPSSLPKPVGFVDLSLSAVGSFDAFQTFLQGVERSLRLLDVRDITITGSDTGVYTYQMHIRLYWLR